MSGRLMYADTQFVRIKTMKNETMFITCRPRDLVSALKSGAHAMCGVLPEDMKLYIRNRLLEDDSSLYDQQVTNDCELYMLTKTPQGDWENINSFLNKTEGSFYRPDSPTK